MTMERVSGRPLRADAVRNRARILKAAWEVFGARGLDAPLDDVAEHAGLGVATLYRRFPDRASLIEALFQVELRGAVDRARAALKRPDPWQAFATLMMSMFRDIAGHRGLREALLSSRHGLGATATATRGELIGLLATVIEAAQRDGSLRRGVTPHDVPPLMLMVGIVADFASATNPGLWERYAGLLLDGLSARAHPGSPTQASLTGRELELAFTLW